MIVSSTGHSRSIPRWNAVDDIRTTPIDGVRTITTRRFEDARGFFSETFVERRFADLGVGFTCVQDNHVVSLRPLTLRGIHYQMPPYAQAKLVRVVHGSALDVAVDLRRGSPTFGECVTTVLSRENWMQVYVPAGFGHATLALEPDTEFNYKVSAPYAPELERGIRFDDPDLAIPWGVPLDKVFLSERDRNLPLVRDQPDLPRYDPTA